MIKYRLICAQEHEFEGWFQNSAACEGQSAAHQIACPVCGSTSVEKALMAPSIATRGEAPGEEAESRLGQLLARLRAQVEATADYVGPRFAEEARRIHYEETEPRAVYGEASRDEAKSLLEEGIAVLPLPRLPEDQN